MGFKEDMSRQFGRIGRKTSALFEETKLRSRISSLENDIKNLYITVGTTMFSMWKHENVDIGRLVKYFEAIQEKQEEIEEKKIQILQVKARGGEDRTEENAGGKPLHPLLPDLNGKRARAGSVTAPAPEDSGNAGAKKDQTSARAGDVETAAGRTEAESGGAGAAAGRTGTESGGAEAAADRTSGKSGGAGTKKDQTVEYVGCARETKDRMSADMGRAGTKKDRMAVDATISMEEESSEEAHGAHSMPGGCSEAAVTDQVVIEEEDEASVLSEGFAVTEVGEMASPDTVQELGYVYCSRCGAACPAGARFCRKCGAKIEV